MPPRRAPSLSPHPLVTVADVPRSSRWYQQVLGAVSAHGGPEYERLEVDGALVLQLHARGIDHHHGALVDPAYPVGNGLLLWFETGEFDAATRRIRAAGAEIVTDEHVNANSGLREMWLRDLDGYVVVIAESAI